MLWQVHGNVKQLPLRFSTSGNNTIIAAPSGTNLLIHGLVLIPSADVTVKINLGSRNVVDMDLKQYMTYSSDDFASMQGAAMWECKTGEAFIINLSSAVSVTGGVDYSYIDTTL